MTGSLKEMLFAQTSTLEGITWCGITPSYLPHVLSVGRPLLKGFDWSRRTRLCMVKFSFHRMTHSDASRWPNYNGLFRFKLISLASAGRHSPVPAQTLRLRFLEAGGISSGSSPRPTSVSPLATAIEVITGLLRATSIRFNSRLVASAAFSTCISLSLRC